MNKGGKFLKNCDAASAEDYNRVINYYQLSWQCKVATVKSFKADVSSVSPSSERMTNARNVSIETFTVAYLRYQLSW